ncbi:ABC transporter ATP-binding protein [Oenococcus sp. UCMA 16435]|nr:ABC transporter ATP-binding protein [Oenococcus sp. UCMA 16435]MDI4584814.1 ATP-binding cassette domain-containing protein [Oenococcus sp. UCMA 14587]
MTLKISHLTGGYGQTNTIKDLNFTVEAGTVTALIGLNGSGKTTTINHVIGLMQPKNGSISFNGQDSRKDSFNYQHNLAYIPELPIIYEDLTLWEHIQTTIAAYHLDSKRVSEETTKLLEIFRLKDKLTWFPIDFSKGMRQKVMIVLALLTNAPLLVVDEPFIGLDPLAVSDLINLLNEKKAAGTTILMSTHLIEGAEKFVDQFLLIDRGQIRARGKMNDIFKAFPQQKTINEIYLQLAREAANG